MSDTPRTEVKVYARCQHRDPLTGQCQKPPAKGNGKYCSKEHAPLWVHFMVNRKPGEACGPRRSQNEVLALLKELRAKGHGRREAAQALGLTVNTVTDYNCRFKLGFPRLGAKR
jgi:hypothetical protein